MILAGIDDDVTLGCLCGPNQMIPGAVCGLLPDGGHLCPEDYTFSELTPQIKEKSKKKKGERTALTPR